MKDMDNETSKAVIKSFTETKDSIKKFLEDEDELIKNYKNIMEMQSKKIKLQDEELARVKKELEIRKSISAKQQNGIEEMIEFLLKIEAKYINANGLVMDNEDIEEYQRLSDTYYC